MNPWPNLDSLQFERKGVSRNVLFGTAMVAFLLYLGVDALSKPYLKHAPGWMGLLPLVGTVVFWWFGMIPTIRHWNDTKPPGYFNGLADYYLFNPGSLEISSDPDPMPLYVQPKKVVAKKRK